MRAASERLRHGTDERYAAAAADPRLQSTGATPRSRRVRVRDGEADLLIRAAARRRHGSGSALYRDDTTPAHSTEPGGIRVDPCWSLRMLAPTTLELEKSRDEFDQIGKATPHRGSTRPSPARIPASIEGGGSRSTPMSGRHRSSNASSPRVAWGFSSVMSPLEHPPSRWYSCRNICRRRWSSSRRSTPRTRRPSHPRRGTCSCPRNRRDGRPSSCWRRYTPRFGRGRGRCYHSCATL